MFGLSIEVVDKPSMYKGFDCRTVAFKHQQTDLLEASVWFQPVIKELILSH